MPDLSHPLNSNKTNKINRNGGSQGRNNRKKERASERELASYALNFLDEAVFFACDQASCCFGTGTFAFCCIVLCRFRNGLSTLGAGAFWVSTTSSTTRFLFLFFPLPFTAQEW